jgi:endonuclease YncB( thermonuclease family)
MNLHGLAGCALLLSVLAPAPAAAARPPRSGGHGARGEVVLDGARTRVRWTDGDSFRIEDGPRRGASARLAGVNALETYGPVHRFGRWRPVELLALARRSAAAAAAEAWTCTAGTRDRYRRLLVDCPAAALALVEVGHALVFSIDGPPPAPLLEAQRRAQAGGAGLWAKGVPPRIPTSVHAAGERGLGRRGPYDRIADTRTGEARASPHRRRYETCEEVCTGEGRARACLVYVPYELRYTRPPGCLSDGR